MLRRLGHPAGLPSGLPGSLSPHSMRHAHATQFGRRRQPARSAPITIGRTATIAGTPAADSGGGRYPVTITATNTEGTATRHFKIVVSRRRRQ